MQKHTNKNTHKYKKYANICKNMQNNHKHANNICKNMQKQSVTCKYMQKFANICRNMQTKITKICTNIKNIQIYAKI